MENFDFFLEILDFLKNLEIFENFGNSENVGNFSFFLAHTVLRWDCPDLRVVSRASSLNTFAGHGPLAHTVLRWDCPDLRVVSRASSLNTFAGQTPPLVAILRRHCSEELFLTWALVGNPTSVWPRGE